MRNLCSTIIILAFTLTGCIYIPVPSDSPARPTGSAIENEGLNLIKVGTTTRENMLLMFGEPDGIFKDQNLFVYRWERRRGVAFGFATVPGGPVPFWNKVSLDYLLLIEFDERGFVKRYETRDSVSEDTYKEIEKW